MLSVINKFDANKIELLQDALDDQRERYVELMHTNIRLQEKASEAISRTVRGALSPPLPLSRYRSHAHARALSSLSLTFPLTLSLSLSLSLAYFLVE